MAIDYKALLTDEQKKAILEQRIAQFANEAYQHNLNKYVAEVSNNEEAIKAAVEALSILETAITVHQEELDKLSSSAI